MKKRMLILVGIITLLLIGVGGKIYMDKKVKKEADKIIDFYVKNEIEIVEDVIKTYDNIKEITFTKIQENKMTGYTHYAFTINGYEGYSYLFHENKMYGDESIVNQNIKNREDELNEDEVAKELEQIKVEYGGWGN